MEKLIFLTVMFFQYISVQGIDLNSLRRTICFKTDQPNCNENFIDVYPHLSKSATNLTDANTFMLLYTRKNRNRPENLQKCAGRLPPNSVFNPKKRVVVIFNPFAGGYCDVASYREWTEQLLQREDLNIIVIEYSWGNFMDYATALMNVRNIVRNQTVILLQNIQEQTGITKDQIILIGHSVGAQVCGLVGSEFPVARIIAIDPAGPGFNADKVHIDDRLDPSDADLVEVWHCNAGKCLPNLGTADDVGHINFYINGGTTQLPCYSHAFEALFKGDILNALGSLLAPPGCFHIVCTQYFKMSINPGRCQFVAVKCDSYSDFKAGKCKDCGKNGENCVIMGWDLDKYLTEVPKTPQKYFLDTKLRCPYCSNKKIKLNGFRKTYESSLQKKSIWTWIG